MKIVKEPIYGPPILDKTNMNAQEIAQAEEKEKLHKIREKRIKKAFKTLKLRWLKNFLFWFFGVLSSVGIVLGAIFVGVKVIPISTYTKWAGQDTSDVVNEEIANKSLIDAILDFDQYTIKDIPAVESFVNSLLAETGMDDFVVVDYEAIKDVKFINSGDGSDLIDEISKCIKLNSEMEYLKEVTVFTEYKEAQCPVEKINGVWVAKNGINQNLYCYLGGTYTDVFANGNVVDQLKNKTEEQMADVEFYFKPIAELSLLDVANDIDNILGRMEITELLSLIAEDGEVDSLIYKLFGGKTIASFLSNTDVSGMLDNVMIKDLGDVEEIFGQLSSLSVFNEWQLVPNDQKPILNSQFRIKYKEGTDEFSSNPEIYYYLASGTHGAEDAEYLPAFDDEGYRVNAVSNSTLLYYPNLSEISFSRALAVIGDSFGTVKISELLDTFGASFDEDSIIDKILSDRTINTIGDIKTEDIKISDLMSYDANKNFYDIILSALSLMPSQGQNESQVEYNLRVKETAESITVSQLKNLDPNGIRLNSIISEKDNKELFDILLQALIITDGSGKVIENPKASDIKSSHLSSFKINNIKLATVLGNKANETLKTVLSQACGVEFSSISISDLSGSKFNMGNIQLTSVMKKDAVTGSYGNNILDAVLNSETEDDPITINNIGQRINGLSLYEAFGKECFTKDKSVSIDKNQTDENKVRKFIFNEQENAFIHVSEAEIAERNISSSDVYYIHENDGIWLLICFNSVEYKDSLVGGTMMDTDGRPEKYVISESTLNDLTGTTIFKSLFKNVTIRQFVDAGIIDDGEGFKDYIYVLNLQQVLDSLDSMPVV